MKLVRLLYTARWPVVVIGVALVTTGCVVGYQAGDPWIFAIGAAGLLLTAIRLLLSRSFDRCFVPSAAAAQLWERRFAIGVVAMAACVGAFAVRCFMLPDVAAHMLAIGLVYGFCAGAVTRYSIRPRVAKLGLGVAVIPATIAVLCNVDMIHWLQGFLFLLFYLGSLETIGHLYETTREQLTLRVEASTLARTDVLTELPNRLWLNEHFEKAMHDLYRTGRGFAVISVDLDFFKDANDRFGHAAGDEILRIVAARLTRLLRPGDLAARVGGDEFVVIQADVADVSEAERLGNRIVAALSADYAIDGGVARLGACVGIAIAPDDGMTLDELLRKADDGLYAVKRSRPAGARHLAPGPNDVPLAPDLTGWGAYDLGSAGAERQARR